MQFEPNTRKKVGESIVYTLHADVRKRPSIFALSLCIPGTRHSFNYIVCWPCSAPKGGKVALACGHFSLSPFCTAKCQPNTGDRDFLQVYVDNSLKFMMYLLCKASFLINILQAGMKLHKDLLCEGNSQELS